MDSARARQKGRLERVRVVSAAAAVLPPRAALRRSWTRESRPRLRLRLVLNPLRPTLGCLALSQREGMSDLRQQLKQFEAAFKQQHGRDPSRDDVRARPEIGTPHGPRLSTPPRGHTDEPKYTQPRNTNSTSERNQLKQKRLPSTRPSRPLRPLPLHLLLPQTRSRLPPNRNAVQVHAPAVKKKKNSRRATEDRRLPRGDSRPVLHKLRLFDRAALLPPNRETTQEAQRFGSRNSSAT